MSTIDNMLWLGCYKAKQVFALMYMNIIIDPLPEELELFFYYYFLLSDWPLKWAALGQLERMRG